MPLYIYGDETCFQLDDNNPKSQHVGFGLLLSESRIDKDIITRAMKNLNNDPQLRKEDRRTLKRGCFHASKDSSNARKHLSLEIAKHVTASIDYTYLALSKIAKSKPKTLITNSQNLSLVLSMTPLFRNREGAIVILEERHNFNNFRARNLFNQLYRQKEKDIYNIPTIPCTFPEIRVGTGKKQIPGLQVVDLLLWALNQSVKQNPNGKWIQNLSLLLSSKHQSADEAWIGGRYFVNREINIPLIKYPTHDLNLNMELDNDELFKSYMLIEKTILCLSKGRLPPHVKHLEKNLQHVLKRLNRSSFKLSPDLARNLCSVFLRFFDTLPIYNKVHSRSRWRNLLNARRIAALFLNNNLPHAIRSCDFVVRSRNLDRLKSPT